MIPNNNLSVLPWYTSIDQQNARKWWVYGREYPLFTPAGFLPPFQVLRAPLRSPIYSETTKGEALEFLSMGAGRVMRLEDGIGVIVMQLPASNRIVEYDVTGLPSVFLENIPLVVPSSGEPCNVAFFDDNGNGIQGLNMDDGTGGIQSTRRVLVPQGATKLYVSYSPTPYSDDAAVYAPQIDGYDFTQIQSVEIYTSAGELVGDFTEAIKIGITMKNLPNYDCIVYPAKLPFVPSFANGQYYARMTDGINVWYSEVFTVVNDIEPYLKLEWWDEEDFVMDAGAIVYTAPAFKNVLYLQADIAKPEYVFEEEGETRDGYYFPAKQISEKRYRFAFFASEYLLDVMRFIRMSDFAQITKNGQVYTLDTFLMTPEWEDNGDVASVEAEFDTATVAKKIGVGYIKAQRGDFNDDFNKDYNT